METKRSSNEEMEKHLKRLSTIQRVEAPDHLYQRIMQRVHLEKKNMIPMRWVVTAAAALTLFFAADAYLIYQNQQTKEQAETASLVPTQTNHLYYE